MDHAARVGIFAVLILGDVVIGHVHHDLVRVVGLLSADFDEAPRQAVVAAVEGVHVQAAYSLEEGGDGVFLADRFRIGRVIQELLRRNA